jgi:low temperature requirement protein LtrA
MPGDPDPRPVPAAPGPAPDGEPSAPRVSTLELFFDLVFVFIVTQVTHVVVHSGGAQDLARAFLVLAVTWWMYGGYSWLTNNVDVGGAAARLLMLALAAMLAADRRAPA